jgi:hypothetical protein
MGIDIQSILDEDIIREKLLFEDYDPIKGIGSQIDRFTFNIYKDDIVYLPDWMKDDELFKVFLRYDSLEDYSEKTETPFEANLIIFNEIREKYDFEYYAATKLVIQDKKQKEKSLLFLINLKGNIMQNYIISL